MTSYQRQRRDDSCKYTQVVTLFLTLILTPACCSSAVVISSPGSDVTTRLSTDTESSTESSTSESGDVAVPAVALTLKIATVEQAPYFSRGPRDGRGGRYSGYIVDLVEMLSPLVPFQYEWIVERTAGTRKNGKWTGMIGKVLSGRADIGAFPFTVHRKHKRIFSFSHPFLHSTMSLLTRRTSSDDDDDNDDVELLFLDEALNDQSSSSSSSISSSSLDFSASGLTFGVVANSRIEHVLRLAAARSRNQTSVASSSSSLSSSSSSSSSSSPPSSPSFTTSTNLYARLWNRIVGDSSSISGVESLERDGRFSSLKEALKHLRESDNQKSKGVRLSESQLRGKESKINPAREERGEHLNKFGEGRGPKTKDEKIEGLGESMDDRNSREGDKAEGGVRSAGKRFALVVESIEATYIASQAPCDLISIDQFLPVLDYSFVVDRRSKTAQDLTGRLNVALAELRRRNALSELQRTWWRISDNCDDEVHGGAERRLGEADMQRIFFTSPYEGDGRWRMQVTASSLQPTAGLRQPISTGSQATVASPQPRASSLVTSSWIKSKASSQFMTSLSPLKVTFVSSANASNTARASKLNFETDYDEKEDEDVDDNEEDYFALERVRIYEEMLRMTWSRTTPYDSVAADLRIREGSTDEMLKFSQGVPATSAMPPTTSAFSSPSLTSTSTYLSPSSLANGTADFYQAYASIDAVEADDDDENASGELLKSHASYDNDAQPIFVGAIKEETSSVGPTVGLSETNISETEKISVDDTSELLNSPPTMAYNMLSSPHPGGAMTRGIPDAVVNSEHLNFEEKRREDEGSFVLDWRASGPERRAVPQPHPQSTTKRPPWRIIEDFEWAFVTDTASQEDGRDYWEGGLSSSPPTSSSSVLSSSRFDSFDQSGFHGGQDYELFRGQLPKFSNDYDESLSRGEDRTVVLDVVSSRTDNVINEISSSTEEKLLPNAHHDLALSSIAAQNYNKASTRDSSPAHDSVTVSDYPLATIRIKNTSVIIKENDHDVTLHDDIIALKNDAYVVKRRDDTDRRLSAPQDVIISDVTASSRHDMTVLGDNRAERSGSSMLVCRRPLLLTVLLAGLIYQGRLRSVVS